MKKMVGAVGIEVVDLEPGIIFPGIHWKVCVYMVGEFYW